MGAKNLQNVEPYNDLFFISCYYNSLFSVLGYYQKDEMPILVNSLSVYKYPGENIQDGFFGIGYESGNEITQLLTDYGMAVRAEEVNEQLITDTENSLLNDQPVLVNVDCYYMPIRPEFYMKQHAPHVILIYGYDAERKTFAIIEQKFRDSLTYQKTEISYTDCLNAYQGFLNLTNPGLMKETYFEYAIQPDARSVKYSREENFRVYREMVQTYEASIREGLSLLARFAKDVERVFLNEQLLRQHVQKLLVGLNEIINAKKVEKHKLVYFWGEEHPLCTMIDEIEGNWGVIRKTLVKYMYSGRYRQKNFVELRGTLEEIYQAEICYYETLFECLSEVEMNGK